MRRPGGLQCDYCQKMAHQPCAYKLDYAVEWMPTQLPLVDSLWVRGRLEDGWGKRKRNRRKLGDTKTKPKVQLSRDLKKKGKAKAADSDSDSGSDEYEDECEDKDTEGEKQVDMGEVSNVELQREPEVVIPHNAQVHMEKLRLQLQDMQAANKDLEHLLELVRSQTAEHQATSASLAKEKQSLSQQLAEMEERNSLLEQDHRTPSDASEFFNQYKELDIEKLLKQAKVLQVDLDNALDEAARARNDRDMWRQRAEQARTVLKGESFLYLSFPC